MKNLYIASFLAILLSLTSEVYALERDKTVNIFTIGAKTDKSQNASMGIGLMYNQEDIKVKLEGTSDFFKIGGAYKFNPYDGKLYMKIGGNYINQTMYAVDNSNTKVNQYSAALATGYMLRDDLYIEVGGSYTKLNGEIFGDYEVKDEKTSLAYLEVAKRWKTKIGTFDTTANASQVFHEYVSDESTYGLGVDYYPTSNSKIGYNYQNEKNNIVSSYSAQYSFLYAEYADNTSMDTYSVEAGVKIAFTDLFDISTWKAPTNIKSHLSELHKFETMTFASNMNIQSSEGVQKTQAAIDRDNTPSTPANSAPTWTATSYNTGLTVNDSSDASQTIKDLTVVSSDNEGDTMSYSIVSISTPDGDDQTAWNNSVYLDNGVLKVRNLSTNDPDTDGTITVVVRVTANGGSNDTSISFEYDE